MSYGGVKNLSQMNSCEWIRRKKHNLCLRYSETLYYSGEFDKIHFISITLIQYSLNTVACLCASYLLICSLLFTSIQSRLCVCMFVCAERVASFTPVLVFRAKCTRGRLSLAAVTGVVFYTCK